MGRPSVAKARSRDLAGAFEPMLPSIARKIGRALLVIGDRQNVLRYRDPVDADSRDDDHIAVGRSAGRTRPY
jgi:hypothetical protein